MSEDRHIVEAVVTNSEGKRTAWIGVGEMKLEDVLPLEKAVLELFGSFLGKQL